MDITPRSTADSTAEGRLKVAITVKPAKKKILKGLIKKCK